MVAIEAWVAWRRALHAVARAGGATTDRDPILGILSAWWADRGFPPARDLSASDAHEVLVEIDRITWSSRPFTIPVP